MVKKEVDPELQRLDELRRKYKFMETNMQNQRTHYESKIPDLKADVEMVKELQKMKEGSELTTQFALADSVYAKATVPKTDRIGLWLGANVMLEYPIDEAEELLNKNLHQTEESVASLAESLDFVREQCTITEVNIARLYNWDVRRRRTQK
ncbi:prefoldin subunit 3 [Sphaeroforma arctica JP610]|uniref:Prefoldin subunit 3 n=1 Tax=Sphaeroforma arctica JP610 TaxID=667725 RepID=A0A0L0FJ17_9EUKA|nr:prefoldin subunit 3 [Sphaeroforma arctica JP610]KNC76018.1 prefoldin subunit 3 [Sphaeroforma arctica JP610]|eukprot:XP_014149920.1 prefoldin subunit 3 [Sphaeroforma arctica JP610]